ncbi:hypothetical protein HDU87_001043 [Geranomyces variabilis]|uniref:Protein kinase domain-containing protein n=1 Tax=Geranomyces variabilis TaxID=109894 RepID=A0AAD5TNA8_9FUNG|nr:hypothetical protein HDU87_001043 [Geranomyces variabilis]
MSVAAAASLAPMARCHARHTHLAQHSNHPPTPASAPASALHSSINASSTSTSTSNSNSNNHNETCNAAPPPRKQPPSVPAAPSLTSAQSTAKKNLIRQFFNSRPSRVGAPSASSLLSTELERKVSSPMSPPPPTPPNPAADDHEGSRCPTPPPPPSPPSPALPEFALSVKEATPTASSPLAAAAASAESSEAADTTTTTLPTSPLLQQAAARNHISPPRAPRTSVLKAKPPPSSPVQRILNRYPLNAQFLAKYFITAELGSGGFGHVLAATCRADGLEVAVKLILKKRIPVHAWARDPELGVMPMEVYLVKRCSHPNIVGFKDFYECERFAYLIMEMHGTQWKVDEHPHTECEPATGAAANPPPPTPRSRLNSHPPHAPDVSSNSTSTSSSAAPPTLAVPPPLLRANSFPAVLTRQPSMDLFEHIEAHSHLPEQHARHIFSQIASALAYLHSLNIVHRDLKDENIVIDASLTVKLIDFGSAAFENASSNKKASFDRFQGTLHYASPEILEGRRYKGKPSDIWAMGVLLYTMLFGECPFKNSDDACGGAYKRPRVPVSDACLALVNLMLEKSPDARPSALEVLNHPWIAAGRSGEENGTVSV